MNSERELFEEWFCDNHTGLKPSELIKFRLDNGYSFKDSIKIDCMWQAWQASAQRQGYKLVPVTANKKMLKAGYDAHDDFFFDGQVQDVYKAMIGVVNEN